MEVQTRNFDGATPVWPTIADAFAEAKKDLSIWKISWTDSSTGERVRLVRTVDYLGEIVWSYEPIDLPKPNQNYEIHSTMDIDRSKHYECFFCEEEVEFSLPPEEITAGLVIHNGFSKARWRHVTTGKRNCNLQAIPSNVEAH